MRLLERLSRAIEAVNLVIGEVVLWLAVAMVTVQFTNVVLRYVFGITFITMQESVIYMHGTLFMLGAGYTLLYNGHVRVDIFYGAASPQKKALIDLIGTVLLLVPMCVLLIVVSDRFVANSWAIREGPMFVGGLRIVYLYKTLVPIFAGLLLLQAVALALRSILVLAGAAESNVRASIHQRSV
jgi:TRAP-type mannitol/chloroaromatic compound transport system permease small subunit